MTFDFNKLKHFNEIYNLAERTYTERSEATDISSQEDYIKLNGMLEKAMRDAFGSDEQFLEASYKGATLLSYAAGHIAPPEPLTRADYDSMYKNSTTIEWALAVRFDSAARMKRLSNELEPKDRAMFLSRLKERFGCEHPANKAVPLPIVA